MTMILEPTNMTFTSDLTVKLVQSYATDESVVAAARVSVIGPDSQDYLETDPQESKGLINFLMKNRHGTPFEHNFFTFFISAPIAVFREFHRHRVGWSYNEESGRYKQLEPEFYVPSSRRALVQQGKPGHYEYVPGTIEQYARTRKAIVESCELAYNQYVSMLDNGIAKEVARGVLPVYIYSSMYASCNARSLMHFLSLRTRNAAAKFPSFPMWEIERVAQKMEHEFARTMPITYNAYHANGRVAP